METNYRIFLIDWPGKIQNNFKLQICCQLYERFKFPAGFLGVSKLLLPWGRIFRNFLTASFWSYKEVKQTGAFKIVHANIASVINSSICKFYINHSHPIWLDLNRPGPTYIIGLRWCPSSIPFVVLFKVCVIGSKTTSTEYRLNKRKKWFFMFINFIWTGSH